MPTVHFKADDVPMLKRRFALLNAQLNNSDGAIPLVPLNPDGSLDLPLDVYPRHVQSFLRLLAKEGKGHTAARALLFSPKHKRANTSMSNVDEAMRYLLATSNSGRSAVTAVRNKTRKLSKLARGSKNKEALSVRIARERGNFTLPKLRPVHGANVHHSSSGHSHRRNTRRRRN